MQPQDEANPDGTHDGADGLVLLIVRTFSAAVLPFLRHDFGGRAFGIPSVLALGLIPLFNAASLGHDQGPLTLFWFAYLTMLLVARLEVAQRERSGRHYHSHYSGAPRLKWLFPKWSEQQVKLYVEPLVTCLLGVVCVPTNEPLGMFLVWSGVSLGIVELVGQRRESEQVRRLQDTIIERVHFHQRVKNLRGRGF